MSISSLNQFQNEIMQDPALQEQFKTAAATSPESLSELAMNIGAERGYSFTPEEVQAAVEAASLNPSVEEALTDEELETVSGGIYGGVIGTVTKATANVVQETGQFVSEGGG